MRLHATVLVVDDDDKTRQMLQDRLQDHCAVLTATGSTQAAEILSRVAVDVLLIDVHATDADGLHLAGLEGNGQRVVLWSACRRPVWRSISAPGQERSQGP